MKKILKTPIKRLDLQDLKVGDIIYLTGHIVTCRDCAHQRLIERGANFPIDLEGGAIVHARPVIREKEGGGFEMIAIAPIKSKPMEKFEPSFINRTGVRLIIGKGGMGAEVTIACMENIAIHAIFLGHCALPSTSLVEAVERVEWRDLGMLDALWVIRVKEYGPLIISIDVKGNNLTRQNKPTIIE